MKQGIASCMRFRKGTDKDTMSAMLFRRGSGIPSMSMRRER